MVTTGLVLLCGSRSDLGVGTPAGSEGLEVGKELESEGTERGGTLTVEGPIDSTNTHIAKPITNTAILGLLALFTRLRSISCLLRFLIIPALIGPFFATPITSRTSSARFAAPPCHYFIHSPGFGKSQAF